jgi:phosphatidylglycerol:prolipoprotein diacylglycerol transferase
MENFWNYYHNIPLYINPTAFHVGFFSISWYALMYLIGFMVVYGLLIYRINKGELGLDGLWKPGLQKVLVMDLLICVFLGLLIGGRLGYVIFYDLKHYLADPLSIISPFDQAGKFIGIYGMSYHGGLIGAILAGLIFSKRKKINFGALANFVSPAIPAGYFFGRIGNFLNNELYGRVTAKPWGMYFSSDPTFQLRHPSQLCEAFLEGIILFAVLWAIRNRESYKEKMLLFYVIGYSFFRIICEFFREPDTQVGFLFGYFTLGQFLSLGTLIMALGVLWKKDKTWYN